VQVLRDLDASDRDSLFKLWCKENRLTPTFLVTCFQAAKIGQSSLSVIDTGFNAIYDAFLEE
jgi:hypothetical protein